MILATWITRQLVFNGFVTGLVIGLVAMGVVLVYRSTRVINFAVGNMGLVGGTLFPLLILNYGWGFWLAMAMALLVGTLFATVIELTVVRRLFNAPRVILLVATVGVAQLAQLIIFQLPDVDAAGNRYPVMIGTLFENPWGTGLRVAGPQLTIILFVPLIAIGLGWLLNRTTFGKSVSAAADNPELSRLSGVNPKVVSTFVWTIAGVLATVSIILLSGQSGSVAGLQNLGPLTLGKAMVASVLAGMRSFPRAVAAGVFIGIAEAVLRFNYLSDPGLIDFLTFVAVLVAVYFQSKDQADEGVFSFAPKVRPVPERLREVWWIKYMTHIASTILVIFAFLLVYTITDLPSRHLLYAQILGFAIAGASVVIVTGWAGQLSLSQMTFAGFGALFAAGLNRGLSMDVDFLGFIPITFQAPSVPFLLSIPLAALFAAALAVVIGLGSLRVRGLFLAVTTFVFAVAAQQYLYKQPFFTGGSSQSVPFRRGEFFGVDLNVQANYYYVCLAFTVVVLMVLSRLRSSGIGRTTIAVRDNIDTASGYTVSPVRSKLSAFALAGGVAGLAGALLAGLIQNVPLSERLFQVGDSLELVGMVVIGGLGSLMGAVLGAVWIYGLPTFFDDAEVVTLFTSSIGLLLVLMYFPGGLIQIGYSIRNALVGFAEGRLPAETGPKTSTAAPVSLRRADLDLPVYNPMLAGRGVSVRFGGNQALSDVSVEVRPDEIVGLIGTNGAGKSTFMNAIGGYIPSTGQVELLGENVSKLGAPDRARRGLGRTFQSAALFPELTVRETVQVALEGRGRTPFMATALFLPPSQAIERRRSAEADELIDFLGLGRYADSFIGDLSTGTRRIVELAGLLALDARVLCLDEPTAGVAQRETEAFGPLIVNIRKELGASMLVIEHDMPLIMSISNRVYCLEAGQVIAEGDPESVRNNPAVVASYLGTDERAIDRSDQGTSA